MPEESIWTSALATATFLHDQLPGGSAYVIGEAGLTTALHEVGYTLTDTDPDFVVLGETRTYSFEAITKAIRLILGGARFIATNPDVTGPSAEGPMPATGSVAALITKATGREPYFVGKPNPMMFRSALNRIEAHSESTVMVGDRMDTDVVAGIEAGLETILVLTGSTTLADIERYPFRPSRVLDSIADAVDLRLTPASGAGVTARPAANIVGRMTDGSQARPLAGVRIIEISSFVAVPLAGMTLAQLGAEVIRVDPVGGAADYHRWPVTDAGDSIYWAGLNKGKRSVAVDVRSEEGQQLIQRLIADAASLITNVAGRQWHSYETLVRAAAGSDPRRGVRTRRRRHRRRLHRQRGHRISAGDRAGGPDAPGQPRTARVGRGMRCLRRARRHRALRHRDATGQGQRISIPLENVALATAGNLSFLTEVMVNGTSRQRIGNSIYGQYGQHFTSGDGASFMIVALTGRHFRDLTEVTGTAKAVAALGEALGADFTDEGDRYRHRDALTGLFTVWFTDHTRERGRRRPVRDVDPVGALPHLRRRRDRARRSPTTRCSPNWISRGSVATWHRGCPCRSTAPTRPQCPLPRSATTPPRCCGTGWACPPRRSHATHRMRARWRERAAAICSTSAGADRRAPGWARPAARRASAPFGGQFMAQSLAAAARTVESATSEA